MECQGTSSQLDLSSSSPSSRLKIVPKDGRRAWLVCFAGFLLQVLIVGVLHVFGIFFVEFIAEFKTTKAAAAWVGSGAYGLSMAITPITSSLVNRYGNRPVVMTGSLICSISLMVTSLVSKFDVMYFTFAVLYGLGTSFSYEPTMCIATGYFDKYVTVATGLMTAGSSTGTLLLAPVAQALNDKVGWRNTMRIFGSLVLIGVWCGWILQPLNPVPRTTSQRIRTSMAKSFINDLQLWKSRVFVIWITAMTLCMFGYYIPHVHLVAHAVDIGISPQKGSMLIMCLGGATATGRIMFGKITQYTILDKLSMHQIALVITGTGFMLLPLIKTITGLVAYVIIIGLVDGCFVVLLPVLTSTMAGSDKEVIAWGFFCGFTSITFTLGPPTAGWIYDATGSYDLAFHVAGIPLILAALVLFLIPWARRTARSSDVVMQATQHDQMFSTLDHINENDGFGLASPMDNLSNESMKTLVLKESSATLDFSTCVYCAGKKSAWRNTGAEILRRPTGSPETSNCVCRSECGMKDRNIIRKAKDPTSHSHTVINSSARFTLSKNSSTCYSSCPPQHMCRSPTEYEGYDGGLLNRDVNPKLSIDIDHVIDSAGVTSHQPTCSLRVISPEASDLATAGLLQTNASTRANSSQPCSPKSRQSFTCNYPHPPRGHQRVCSPRVQASCSDFQRNQATFDNEMSHDNVNSLLSLPATLEGVSQPSERHPILSDSNIMSCMHRSRVCSESEVYRCTKSVA